MRTTTLLLCLLLVGCPPTPRQPDNDQCAIAETKLLDLKCADVRGELLGGPNKHGVPFRNRCVSTQDTGVRLNPTCLARITDCKEVDPCLQAP